MRFVMQNVIYRVNYTHTTNDFSYYSKDFQKVDTSELFHLIYSLKRTNSVLQEHEEALQKKKEMVLAKTQQSRQVYLR